MDMNLDRAQGIANYRIPTVEIRKISPGLAAAAGGHVTLDGRAYHSRRLPDTTAAVHS